MTHLYTLTEQHKELQKLAELDSDDIAISDTMEAIQGEFEDKAKSLIHVVNGMGSDVEEIDREIKRLQERKKTIVNRQASARDYLRINMEASGITKISCPLFTITLAKGRDMVEIDNVNELPTDYVDIVTDIKPMKKEIMSALKSGESIPGARLVKTKTSVRIK